MGLAGIYLQTILGIDSVCPMIDAPGPLLNYHIVFFRLISASFRVIEDNASV